MNVQLYIDFPIILWLSQGGNPYIMDYSNTTNKTYYHILNFGGGSNLGERQGRAES